MLVAAVFSLYALCGASLPLFGAEPDYGEMLKKVDALVNFGTSDFSAEYTITQDRPGGQKSVVVAAVFRRDSKDSFLVLVLDPPEDKGKGYLKIEDGLWFYDARSRVFSFTDARERFQNSNARNSDFTSSDFASDYSVKSARREKLGKFDCHVLDLEATSPEVPVARVRVWIDQENLVRKSVDYSVSGQALRTTAIPSYQKVGDRYVAASVTIVDNLRGATVGGKFVNESTKIVMAKPSLARLPDSVFTKSWLESMGR